MSFSSFGFAVVWLGGLQIPSQFQRFRNSTKKEERSSKLSFEVCRDKKRGEMNATGAPSPSLKQSVSKMSQLEMEDAKEDEYEPLEDPEFDEPLEDPTGWRFV